MLSLYLINEGDKSPLSGALNYGMPYNIEDNVEYFRYNGHRFYDFGMGFNLYLILCTKLEELKKFIKPDELEHYTL